MIFEFNLAGGTSTRSSQRGPPAGSTSTWSTQGGPTRTRYKITFWRLSLRENSNVSLFLAGNSKCLFLRQVGSDGEERDFEDLLAHLAARIKLRFGRVCYRLDIRLQCIPLIRSTGVKVIPDIRSIFDGTEWHSNSKCDQM